MPMGMIGLAGGDKFKVCGSKFEVIRAERYIIVFDFSDSTPNSELRIQNWYYNSIPIFFINIEAFMLWQMPLFNL